MTIYERILKNAPSRHPASGNTFMNFPEDPRALLAGTRISGIHEGQKVRIHIDSVKMKKMKDMPSLFEYELN